MKERMHIYRVAVPDIPAGGSISSLPLQLDSDAPFTARAISFAGADGGVTLGDVTTLVRFRGPNGLYRSSDFIPAFVLCPASGSTQYLGNGTAWRPLYPEITWPENATILIDVKNTGAVTLSGMVVFFRGVKQYQDSRDVPGSSVYPGSYSSTAFDLSRWVSIPDVGMVDNIALNAPSDGSIVLRGALLGMLRDPWGNSLADDYQALCLLGTPTTYAYGFQVQYQTETLGVPAPVEPEIHCPAGSGMVIDLKLAGGAAPGDGASSLFFYGVKRYRSCGQ